jgi:hypothetical protein
MTWSVKIQPITPRAEHSRREPKNVETPLAPGSEVEKMSVPTHPRMMRNPNNAPANAPSTPLAECLILTELNQYERKSETGRARTNPQKSPIKMGSAIFI